MTRSMTVPQTEERPLLDLVEAAAIFDIGRTRAYYLANSGAFPVEVLRIGGRLKVRTRDVRTFLGLD
jgi:Helix-turn-helix domain